MKKEIGKLDATPSKRTFLSIIADYDLNRSICELIDNGLDVWVRGGKAKTITIKVTLDEGQQTITVEDNAGGLPKHELRYIVGPGQTGTSPTEQTIGIFGVGTKRAVVALAQDIRIKTRHAAEKTHQVEFDDHWLADDDWELPLYEVGDIAKGTTVVELQRLRVQVSDDAIAHLKEHLSTTYARFLVNSQVEILLNGTPISPQFFDNWAYPPDFSPRKYNGELQTADGHSVKVEAIAGLSSESSPASGEYGVYFYCNDRLVARGLKTLETGFTRGLAGLPHPKISLTKVLVCLNGNAASMPWNSSKSDISTKHEIFQALQGWLVQVVKDYAALSRIWMGEWPEKVFKYKEGTITDVNITDFPSVKKSFLPPMPKSRPRYSDLLEQNNRKVVKKKPWTKGLYEGIVAADLISKQHLEQKNRIALIVLDSTLEIAFKEYLVNDSGHVYNDAKLISLFANRNDVQNEIKKYVKISNDTWKKINHYYRLRCKLVHERVTVGSLDDGKVSKAVIQIYGELSGLLDANDNRWKARIPGKQLLAKFAAKANIDPVRLKTLYLHIAAQNEPSPFQEVFDIFASFDSLGRAG
jgi:Histidine kinase-, DNA gyrase B-, and HSP90-like ATPase